LIRYVFHIRRLWQPDFAKIATRIAGGVDAVTV
jgi:hypothetical protein